MATSSRAYQLENDVESSFKKDVERSVKPNGDVELQYNGLRFSPTGLIAFVVAAGIVLLPVSCAATYPFVEDRSSGTWNWTILMLIFWSIAMGICTFGFAKTKKKLVARPGQGIVIEGRNLPFKDITDIGVDFVSHTEHAYFAYAESHGKKIKLTCWVTQTSANAIADAVRNEAKKAK